MPDLSRMTHKNWDVLALLIEGLTDREIGRRLSVSESTVKSHIRRILEIFGAKSRIEVTAYAYHSGLITSRNEEGAWVLSDDLFGQLALMVDYLRRGEAEEAGELARGNSHRLPRSYQLERVRREAGPTGHLPGRTPDVRAPRPSSART